MEIKNLKNNWNKFQKQYFEKQSLSRQEELAEQVRQKQEIAAHELEVILNLIFYSFVWIF